MKNEIITSVLEKMSSRHVYSIFLPPRSVFENVAALRVSMGRSRPTKRRNTVEKLGKRNGERHS